MAVTAKHSRRRRAGAAILLLSAVVLVVTAWLAGFFASDPFHLSRPTGAQNPALAALYFSGDMGLRFGAGPYTYNTLHARGLPVLGMSSSTAFRVYRDRAFVDRFVARAVSTALARTGAQRLVVIGQSYGADILQTGLARLPAPLRAKIAAIVLVVPGDNVFFRADPSDLSYHGTPDSIGTSTARTLTWAPLTCIYGNAETDSLCPDLRQPNAKVVGLPGGHFLGNNYALLEAHILVAVDRAGGRRS